ncbi:MAG: (d)CMP kinase [Clostridia bacterium]|nr:(d)CMP kinase [Clostridia bacterium]
MAFVVAIDGPAGSGKGTLAKLISEKYGLVNVDTGAMYRCLTLYLVRKGITVEEVDKVEAELPNINIRIERRDGEQYFYLNDEDVSKEIRTTKVNENVAKFAQLKCVRDMVTPMQREMGKTQDVIMEGRDITTVVFPNADVKIYLDCSEEERANRRYKQNLEKGIECTYEEVLKSIQERNRLETEREIAPLTKAEDAIVIDSTNLSIPEVAEAAYKIIDAKKEELK